MKEVVGIGAQDLAAEMRATSYSGGPPFARCNATEPRQVVPGVPWIRSIDCEADALGFEGGAQTLDTIRVSPGLYELDAVNAVDIQGCDVGKDLPGAGGPRLYFGALDESIYSVRQSKKASGETSLLLRNWVPSDACAPGGASEPYLVRSQHNRIRVDIDRAVAIPLEFEVPMEVASFNRPIATLCDADCQCSEIDINANGATRVDPGKVYWLVTPATNSDAAGYVDLSAI
ncbi:MAG TPA: hypothetical protein VLC09_21200 [Polyangiaceae bacterium]|nr:hypothetical protein [Polyangiaceae bacterium]